MADMQWISYEPTLGLYVTMNVNVSSLRLLAIRAFLPPCKTLIANTWATICDNCWSIRLSYHQPALDINIFED